VSEFSSSFHIRTTSPTDTEWRLREAKLSGLVFGPKNGWLTFVPYRDTDGITGSHDDAGTANAIAATTGETVLYFQFAQDHGWSVAMVKPGQFLGLFSCAWDHEPIAVHDNLDRQVLEEIVHAPSLEQFLRETEPSVNKTPLAFGFAEAIGLPAYRWLSPRYIEKHTQHYVDAGARKIGRKPAPAPTTALPSPVKLELPKADLTAREALALLLPIMTWCRPPWTLRMVSGSSRQGWDFRYFNPVLRETVQSYLFPNGNAGCRSLGRAPAEISISKEEIAQRIAAMRSDPKFASMLDDPELAKAVKEIESGEAAPPMPTALPDQWLDSDKILAIADGLQPPDELGSISLIRSLSLECSRDPPARWRVRSMAENRNINKLDWTIEFDAQTGKLLREVLSRPGKGRESWIIRPWRERTEGGSWRDL
jgi:hypothetical protein